MDLPNTFTLSKVWADATPLATYIEERASQKVRPSTLVRKPTRRRPHSTIEYATLTIESTAKLASARAEVRSTTINDLIAARVVGIGRLSDSYELRPIPDSFWIAAKVDWILGTVSRDGTTFIDIRLVSPDVVLPPQPVMQVPPRRLSKRDAIRAAIVAYAKDDPTLDRNPNHRFQAYRAYLMSLDYNPRKDRGFSAKNFEKYETEFRNANKHLFPT